MQDSIKYQGDHTKMSTPTDLSSKNNPEKDLVTAMQSSVLNVQTPKDQQGVKPPTASSSKEKEADITAINSMKEGIKPKKRCPQKDTILISIPLHVTADLGVAIQRTRRRRELRVKRWLAEVCDSNKQQQLKEQKGELTVNDKNIQDGDVLDSEDDEGPILKKEQYGSVLDYLEAKYVRGVSISQYNSHGERVKRGVDKNNEGDGSDEGEEVFDSDEDDNRSVYGDDGFIDDTLLQEEVVDQVFASDSYGKTKIEIEAKKRRQEQKSKDDEEGILSATESDFDDGFFVNIGDLEMEEGWKGDFDAVISPLKRKPGRPKKSGSEDRDVGAKSKSKKRKVDAEPSSPKTKKNKKLEKKKAVKDKSTSKTKDSDGKAMVIKTKGSSYSDENDTKSQSKQSPSKTTPQKSRSKPKDEPQTPKSILDNLAKQVKRKFNICVKQINQLTPKHLPRKPKVKSTAKITVNIPEDKDIGDTIMFDNPHVPGQKLKVTIPGKANMETRTFIATVPIPKQPLPEPKENDLPKELREALFNYSQMHNEWVNAKAVYLTSLPPEKREEFKPTAERNKKFDSLVAEFPNNIATPIDASYIRLVVRRIHQNKMRVQARANSASSAKAKPVDVMKEDDVVMVSVKLDAPQRGIIFDSITFDKTRFVS